MLSDRITENWVKEYGVCYLQFSGLDISKSAKRTRKDADYAYLNMPGKFEKSKRGATWLVDPSGYRYFVNKSNGVRIYWKCCRYQTEQKCLSRAVTQGDTLIYTYGTHNHTP